MEQISFFDIQLPSTEDVKREFITEKKSVGDSIDISASFARVPDDEFTRLPNIEKLPSLESILKKIQANSYSVSIHEFLQDIYEIGAIALSNRFSYRQDREDSYLKIINKYDKKTQLKIVDIFTDIFEMLSFSIYTHFEDYLGELFMRSETSNKKTGQFFTPYCVSKMCAETAIDPQIVNEFMESDKILTLNEPTCGAGGMIVAAIDVLYNKYHFNYSRNLLVECSDIDRRCVHMTYLQLACIGVPAIIYHRDTLSMQTWDRWETPAYIMQYLRFKDIL